ncbi:MAG TPA: GspH/FimT family pseudopilin [Xanthomonadaceae bacterium]|nr:GspH/FimT family pseudopilin [Xanthomonadaceae bacterium]
MKSQVGFTLVELVVTLAVAAILMAAATPSLRDLIQNNRATAYSNELVLAMTMARAEALKRSGPVTVCAAAPADPVTGMPTGCASDPLWTQGWLLFQDAATSGAPNPTGTGAELIRVWPAVPGLESAVIGEGSMPRAIRFTRQGGASMFPDGASRSFSVQAKACRGEQARELRVAPMGRVSVTRKECA